MPTPRHASDWPQTATTHGRHCSTISSPAVRVRPARSPTDLESSPSPFPPTHPTVLIVASADSTDTVRHEDLDDALGALGDRSTDDAQLATRRGHRSVFLLPADVDLALVDAVCAEQGLRGSVVAHRPIAEVSANYRLADDGLDAAPEHAFDDRAVLDEGDNQLLALLTARPFADTNAVVAAVLGPLAEPAHDHLLAGLAAFIATGTATGAAAALHVHPQTLRYRLRRARGLTGRDPRRAWHGSHSIPRYSYVSGNGPPDPLAVPPMSLSSSVAGPHTRPGRETR